MSTVDYLEIIVASYSGRIISFTTEPVLSRAVEDTYGRSIQTVNNENRIKHMRKEVEELKKKLEKEREKVKKLNSSSFNNNGNNNTEQQLKPALEFPVNSKFQMDTVLAAYVLTIELQTPIDLIILRSPVVLDLVEADTGTSVLSVTPPHLQLLQSAASSSSGSITNASSSSSSNDDSSGQGGKFVAVFRCQSQEKRIALTLRTNEGEHGELLVTIVADPGSNTAKAAKIIKYDLKPLSLHTRVYELTAEETARPKNKMRYTGNSYDIYNNKSTLSH